jgi:hypothetical protein
MVARGGKMEKCQPGGKGGGEHTYELVRRTLVSYPGLA